MPLIFRSMIRDGDRPRVGTMAKTLGARIPGDISKHEGLVVPGTGSMSVCRSWRDLPVWHIPERFIRLVPGAVGRASKDPIISLWRMGEGPFEIGKVAEKLNLRPDSATHGLVEPSEPMTSENYQTVLAETRNLWLCIDEELEHE